MKKLNDLQLSSFANQITMSLNAGITISECLSITAEDDQKHQEIFKTVITSLDEGQSFSDSIKQTELFPDYFIDTISIGEMAGNLDKTMESLANYYSAKHNIFENIKSAIIYPLSMVIMMLAIIVILALKVMPIFSDVYNQLGLEANTLSASIMSSANLLFKVSIVIIVVIFVFALVMLVLNASEKGKDKLSAFLTIFPLTKDVYLSLSQTRFAFGMSTMVSSGIDYVEALKMTLPTLSQKSYRDKVSKALEDVISGESFEDVMSKHNLFTSLDSRLLKAASKTGDVDQVLKRLADQYMDKFYTTINSKIAVVEPILVIGFALIIGLILLSVVLPLLSVMSGLL